MNSAVSRFQAILKAGCIFFFLLALVSCAALGGGDSKKDEKTLLLSLEAFNSAIRWGDSKQAAPWIIPQLQDYFWTLADELQCHVRIMDYEVRHVSSIATAEKQPSAEVVLRYRYYHTNDPHLQTRTIHQRWKYSEEAKVWQLTQHDLQMLVPAAKQ